MLYEGGKLYIENETPIFYKARSVPYAMKELSAELLVHFYANKYIVITCDASQYGVGALMSHIMEDMSELLLSHQKL